MSGGARLTSIDAVRKMAAAVQAFRDVAGSAADELQMEMRRAAEWIHHDRKEYWARELRRAYDRLADAKVQLQQAKTYRRIGDRAPSCIDEKKAVEAASRRLRLVEEKVEAVRRWERVIERNIDECRGALTQFSGTVQLDLTKGLAALDRMTESLETYVAAGIPANLAPQPLEKSSPAAREPAKEPDA